MLRDLVSSPTRLARFFKDSKDKWKAKSLANQQRIRELDVRVRDLERSREKWKQEAKQSQFELAALARQVVSRQPVVSVLDVVGEGAGNSSQSSSTTHAEWIYTLRTLR